MTSYSILNGCDKINSIEEANRPVVSPLLPVKGLRHDDNGDLTADAINIIKDGIKSLGIDIESDSAREAILTEVKHTLCIINNQYQFMLSKYSESMALGKPVDDKLVMQIKEKNQAMRDVISLSRHVLDMPLKKDNKMVEGFIGSTSTLDDNMRKELSQLSGDLKNFKIRNYQVSQEKNKSVNAYLSLYGFLNVVAIGLLFYIVSVKTPVE
jgi:hypothetical protein